MATGKYNHDINIYLLPIISTVQMIQNTKLQMQQAQLFF